MKGTATLVLIMDETPAERKAILWSSIRSDRELVQSLCALNEDEQLDEAISITRNTIKETFAELVELERWRKRNGYAPDQPYVPSSLKAKLESMSEDQLIAYYEHKAKLQAKIYELECELKEREYL